MNRTETCKRIHSLLSKQEMTTAQIRDELGFSHPMTYQALRRLAAKGKVTKAVDGEGYLYWKAAPGN